MADDYTRQIIGRDYPVQQDTQPQELPSAAATAPAPTQSPQTPQGVPLSQEAYDSFVSRTGVPLAPEAVKTLLPMLQKRKADMIQEDLQNSASPTSKSLSKMDIFLHGYKDAMNTAQAKQQAEEQSRLNRWKLFNQDAQQFAGIDPKTALGLLKEEKKAANDARKNDIVEKHNDAAQKTRDVLANGKIDFWNKQGKHLADHDEETATHHRALEAQSQWTRQSINDLQQDKLKLDKYKVEIYAGKASTDTQQKAQRLQQEMAAKLTAVNAGINKFNIARQFELSKVNQKTGKPLYMDENGNVPAYTPIPIIQPEQQGPEPEAAPLTPFPEMPEISGAPQAPPQLRATAQMMPPQGQPQGQMPGGGYNSIGAMPTNMVPNLPTGGTLPPPPSRQLFNNPPATPAAASRQISSVKSAKDTAAAIKPDSRKKAEAIYYQLVGKGMDPKAAFAQAKKENPY
jgi:hypothetical protein